MDPRSERASALVEGNDLQPHSHKESFRADDSGTSNVAGASANLINAAIGAGLLAIPFAQQCSGVILGSVLLVLFGTITAYSLHIMGRAQQYANASSYQMTVKLLLGPKAEICIIIIQLVYLWGACIGYLDIIPDQLVPVVSEWTAPDSFFANRTFIICAVQIVILLPLMLIRNINHLWPLAAFAIAAIVYTSFLIVGRAFVKLREDGLPEIVIGEPTGIGTQLSWFRSSTDIVKALPIICFAFNVHTTYPIVFAELNAPKRLSRMDKAAGSSMLVCIVVYLICGLSGYMYGIAMDGIEVIPGDCLQMYPAAIDITIGRICIAISVVGSYTTLHFSARACMEDLLKALGLISQDGLTFRQGLCEIVAFVACTVGVSLVVTKLDFVLDIVGSVAACPFMFVFPGLLQTAIDSQKGFSMTSKSNGIALIILGITIAIAGLVSTIMSAM